MCGPGKGTASQMYREADEEEGIVQAGVSRRRPRSLPARLKSLAARTGPHPARRASLCQGGLGRITGAPLPSTALSNASYRPNRGVTRLDRRLVQYEDRDPPSSSTCCVIEAWSSASVPCAVSTTRSAFTNSPDPADQGSDAEDPRRAAARRTSSTPTAPALLRGASGPRGGVTQDRPRGVAAQDIPRRRGC